MISETSLANEPAFLLLDNRVGWQALVPPTGIELGALLRLQALPGNGRPLADESGGFGGLSLPSALALDCQGRIYVLDGERICRYDPCQGSFQVLRHIGGAGSRPRQFYKPQGLGISCRDDIYVADSGNRRVQVFAVKGLVLRAVLGPYRAVVRGEALFMAPVQPASTTDPNMQKTGEASFPEGTWLPWDMALGPDSKAYVSDTANGLIHVFDARFRWQQAWDGREEGGLALEKPTHLALDKEGYLYVIQAGKEDVVVLDPQGRFVRRVHKPAEIKENFFPAAIGFDPQGRLHLTDARTGCLYVYDERGVSAIKCQDFKGRCCAIASDQAGNLLLADKLSKLVYQLEESASYTASGVFLAGPLDSQIYRCGWHRVMLDGKVEPGTTVKVDTFTSDAPLGEGQILSLPDYRWETGQVRSQVGEGGWDCLVRSQGGRYLWLRLSLSGDGVHSPSIRSIHIDYPRRSSLRYLPGVFREDPLSADFLDRFLSIMDRLWGGIGETLAHMDWYFDPMSTPARSRNPRETDFLTWLASWLGLALEAHWPEEARRRLVAEAHRLYALRGTVEGVRQYVALYTGKEPQILEHFKLRRWVYLNQARLGNDSVLWGAGVLDRLQLDVHSQIGDFRLQDSGDPQRDPFHFYAHQFTIYVSLAGADELQQRTIQRIVEMAKPAHVKAYVTFVQPRLLIGRQSILGVNTIVGNYPSGVRTGEGALGQDTVLSSSEDEAGGPTLRIGVRSRLGSSTWLT